MTITLNAEQRALLDGGGPSRQMAMRRARFGGNGRCNRTDFQFNRHIFPVFPLTGGLGLRLFLEETG